MLAIFSLPFVVNLKTQLKYLADLVQAVGRQPAAAVYEPVQLAGIDAAILRDAIPAH